MKSKALMVAIVSFVSVLIIVLLLHSNKNQTYASESPVQKLDETVDIIFNLIKTDKADLLFEDRPTRKAAEIILKNVSPAEIALEMDVLAYDKPTFILYDSPQRENFESLYKQFEQLATRYEGVYIFAFIAQDKLPKLFEQGEVDQTPTIIKVVDRKEELRLEGIEQVQQIESYLQEPSSLPFSNTVASEIT